MLKKYTKEKMTSKIKIGPDNQVIKNVLDYSKTLEVKRLSQKLAVYHLN